jgi:hypothetical protein
MTKTILQGTLEGSRGRGRQRKNWFENIKKWTKLATPYLLRKAEDQPHWSALSALSTISPYDQVDHGTKGKR